MQDATWQGSTAKDGPSRKRYVAMAEVRLLAGPIWSSSGRCTSPQKPKSQNKGFGKSVFAEVLPDFRQCSARPWNRYIRFLIASSTREFRCRRPSAGFGCTDHRSEGMGKP